MNNLLQTACRLVRQGTNGNTLFNLFPNKYLLNFNLKQCIKRKTVIYFPIGWTDMAAYEGCGSGSDQYVSNIPRRNEFVYNLVYFNRVSSSSATWATARLLDPRMTRPISIRQLAHCKMGRVVWLKWAESSQIF